MLLLYKNPLNQTLIAFYYALVNCGRELSFNLLSQRAAAILLWTDYSFRHFINAGHYCTITLDPVGYQTSGSRKGAKRGENKSNATFPSQQQPL